MAEFTSKIDVSKLLTESLDAARSILKNHWDDAKEFVEKSSKDFLNTAIMIEKLKFLGKITEENAKLLVEEQKIIARMNLTTLVGIGLILASQVINAILGVLGSALNVAIGWPIF